MITLTLTRTVKDGRKSVKKAKEFNVSGWLVLGALLVLNGYVSIFAFAWLAIGYNVFKLAWKLEPVEGSPIIKFILRLFTMAFWPIVLTILLLDRQEARNEVFSKLKSIVSNKHYRLKNPVEIL